MRSDRLKRLENVPKENNDPGNFNLFPTFTEIHNLIL